jgi:hypothetical protein
MKFKLPICEAHFLLLQKNREVGINFTNFYEAELMKLDVFGKQF